MLSKLKFVIFINRFWYVWSTNESKICVREFQIKSSNIFAWPIWRNFEIHQRNKREWILISLNLIYFDSIPWTIHDEQFLRQTSSDQQPQSKNCLANMKVTNSIKETNFPRNWDIFEYFCVNSFLFPSPFLWVGLDFLWKCLLPFALALSTKKNYVSLNVESPSAFRL